MSASLYAYLDNSEEDLNELFDQYGLTNYDSIISRQEAIKRNTEIVECDKCGVTGNYPNMMRWHFENCKSTVRHCEHCNNAIPRQGIKETQYKHKKYCNRSCYMASKKGKIAINMTPEIKQKLRVHACNRSPKTLKLIGENSAKARTGKKRGKYKKRTI